MGEGRGQSTVLKDRKESYKHAAAKTVLAEWLAEDYEVKTEVKFDNDGWKFIVDVVTYTNGHIQTFYEVVHQHPVDAVKLGRLQYYCMVNRLNILCHEIDAEWILRQIAKPEIFVKFTYDLNANDETI
jgi:hypothetical protein